MDQQCATAAEADPPVGLAAFAWSYQRDQAGNFVSTDSDAPAWSLSAWRNQPRSGDPIDREILNRIEQSRGNSRSKLHGSVRA